MVYFLKKRVKARWIHWSVDYKRCTCDWRRYRWKVTGSRCLLFLAWYSHTFFLFFLFTKN